MEDQGFRLVGVEGELDRKVEVWIRENTGQGAATITGDGYDVAWNILTLKELMEVKATGMLHYIRQ